MISISGYKLLQPVAGGAQARLFRAETGGAPCAVKIFPPEMGAHAAQEAKVLASLHHPNVVALLESGSSEAGPFLAMEWVEGEALAAKNLPHRWPEFRSLLLGILAGLQAIHEQGLVHGDIKNENILLGAQGIKLVDLGFARPSEHPQDIPTGTLAYLAPELLFGHPATPASDLYALGITLYRWIRGDFPFALETPTEVLRWHLFETPLHPGTASGFPLELGDLILALLGKSLMDRPRHVDDLLQRFSALFELEEKTSDTETIAEESGFELYGEAIRHYEAQEKLNEGETLLLAELYYRQGYPAQALERIQKMASPSADLLRVKIRTRMGKFSEARTDLERLKASPNSLNAAQHLSLLNSEGILHFYLGEIEAAEQAFTQAEKIARRSHQLSPLASAYNNLGNIYLEKQDAKNAEKYFRKSVEFSREAGDRIHEGMFQSSLGYFHHRQNAPMEALASYDEGLRLLNALGQKSEAARTQLNRANLLLSLGDAETAHVDLLRAQKIFKARKLDYLFAYSRQIEGEILRKKGQIAPAAKLFGEIREELTRLGRHSDASWALLHQGECLLELKDSSGVQTILELADQFSSRPEAQNPRWRGHWHFLRARQLWSQMRPEAEILGEFAEAETALQESSDLEALALLHYAQGCFHQQSGQSEASRKNLENSLRKLNALAQKLPEPWKLRYFAQSPRAQIERMLHMETPALPRRDELFETALRQLQNDLVGELELSSLVEKILDRMITLTGAERGFILMKEAEGPRIVVSRNIDQAKIEKSADQISGSIASEVLEKGVPLLTVDALEDARFSITASIHQMKLRSILCIPLKREGEILGAVYLDNRERPSVFHPSLASALTPFADMMGRVLANARRFFEVQSDLNRTRKKLEAAETDLKMKYDYRNIVGRHPKMLEIFKVLDRVTDVDVPVMIFGESGVGKERIAKAIHFNGPRAARGFVAFNCQAVPENLFESELFGHVRGAFTGAVADRVGLVEQAHQGTLFLDEIGDMPTALQGKLLRVLQEGKFRPVGAKQERQVDCRILSATHRDLRAMIRKGEFREDLWFRLNVIEIRVPALRERMEDLPLLIDHFLEEFAQRHHQKKKKLGAAALDLLSKYTWPGNVRELENTLTNACVFAEGDSLVPEAFRYKRELFGATLPNSSSTWEEFERYPSYREAQQAFEKKFLARAMEKAQGNISRASLDLRIARPQLSRLVKKHRIRVP